MACQRMCAHVHVHACMCIQALLYQKQKRKVWLDKSDEAFCTKSATKSTTEAVSCSVPTAFRLPHLHMK